MSDDHGRAARWCGSSGTVASWMRIAAAAASGASWGREWQFPCATRNSTHLVPTRQPR